MTIDVATRSHLASLTEASMALAGAGLDPPVVLDTITEVLVKHLGGSAVAYTLADDGLAFELASVSSNDPAVTQRVLRIEEQVSHAAEGDGLLARCARSRLPLRIPEVDAAALSPVPVEYRESLARPAMRSLLFVPLMTGDAVLGVLTVVRSLEYEAPLEDAEVDLACDLAELAARSLANAHLHRSLAATMALFWAAFEAAPIGMALVSVTAGPELGRLLWVNAALAEVSGYDTATLATMSVLDIFHTEARPRIEAGLAAASERDLGDSLARGRLLRSDGSVIEVRIDARAVPVEDRPARIGLLQVHSAD